MPDRDTRIHNALRWIENAGLHIDTEAELVAELFDPGKPLTMYRTVGLRDRMIAHWREHRPRGERSELSFEARAANRVKLRAHLEHQPRLKAVPEPKE